MHGPPLNPITIICRQPWVYFVQVYFVQWAEWFSGLLERCRVAPHRGPLARPTGAHRSPAKPATPQARGPGAPGPCACQPLIHQITGTLLSPLPRPRRRSLAPRRPGVRTPLRNSSCARLHACVPGTAPLRVVCPLLAQLVQHCRVYSTSTRSARPTSTTARPIATSTAGPFAPDRASLHVGSLFACCSSGQALAKDPWALVTTVQTAAPTSPQWPPRRQMT